jgi:hypothetical protein
MGRFEWKELGLEYKLQELEPPSQESLERTCAALRAARLEAY